MNKNYVKIVLLGEGNLSL